MSTCQRCGQRTRGRLCATCRLDDRDYSGTCAVCGEDVQYISVCDDCSETAARARDDAASSPAESDRRHSPDVEVTQE